MLKSTTCALKRRKSGQFGSRCKSTKAIKNKVLKNVAADPLDIEEARHSLDNETKLLRAKETTVPLFKPPGSNLTDSNIPEINKENYEEPPEKLYVLPIERSLDSIPDEPQPNTIEVENKKHNGLLSSHPTKSNNGTNEV